MDNRIIYLIGPRGSGKSRIGTALAEELGFRFVDTDEYMLESGGMTVQEVVDQHGWDEFRRRESEALRAVSLPGRVVATGGGMVLSRDNREHMRATGTVVYLHAPVAELCRRISQDNDDAARPSLTGADPVEEMAAVVRERTPLYESCAHHSVDAADELETVMTRVIMAVREPPQ